MITTTESEVVTLSPGDPGYAFQDGFALMQRASLVISPDCPQRVALMITSAIDNGWIQLRANLHRDEYILDRMRNG